MARPAQRAPAEAGYNMVALVIIILLMNVAVATALPMWSTVIQREREEELIFRGLQYAEAVRVFQQRHGRLPVKLDELIKVEPRSIRQLWKDPMTEGGDWGIVLAAAAKRPGGQRNNQGQQDREKGKPGDPGPDVGLPGTSDPNLPKGPIVGVFSRSTESSVKVFFDQQRYSDWKFTLPLITAQGGGGKGSATNAATSGHVGDATRRSGGAPRLNVRWLGRPFRPGVEPLAAGQPGGNGLPQSDMETRPAGGSLGQDLVPNNRN